MKPAKDEFVPDKQVRDEFGGINPMRLWRWTHNKRMQFPPPIKINGRNFRSRAALEEFKQRKINEAMKAGA
jgi:hypothetical protein